MPEFKFTNKAVEDLSEIWNYTFDKWSEGQADSYYNLIIESCQKIADNPETGKNYQFILNNLFGFRAGRHIIFYRKLARNKVEITRILHEQMDFENRILE